MNCHKPGFLYIKASESNDALAGSYVFDRFPFFSLTTNEKRTREKLPNYTKLALGSFVVIM